MLRWSPDPLRCASSRKILYPSLPGDGWGLGLWGKVGPARQLLIALAIYFLIQVPLAAWWLRRFEYGPLEHLWRLGTYGRRAAQPAVAAAG